MDSASTFIRRKKQSQQQQQFQQQQAAPFSQFTTLQQTGPLFTPPSASYPAAASSHHAAAAHYTSGAHSLRRREPAGVARLNQGGFLPPAAPQRSLSSTGYAATSGRSHSTERHAPTQAWGSSSYESQQQQFAQTQPSRPSGSAAAVRTHRVAPETLPRRSYPSPPSTAPVGAQRPTLGALPYAPSSSYSGHAASDEGARARALLIDRERRQIFSYLSSPNCFLFSVATGPVGLTEEDLDLLLAAGGTSVWTLMHLRALDAAGARFKDFANLIPAVARASQAQAEQNRSVLAWLTSTACTLFGPPQQSQGANGPDPSLLVNNPVLLSMADIERLVIESGAGLDTLALLERLQEMQDSNRAQKCDTFQSLIEQIRESVHQIKASNNAAAAAAANAQAGGKKGRHKSQGSVHDASALAQTQQPPSEADSEDRRLVLEYLSSGGCALFSRADPTRPVVATAAALDALVQHCGGSGAQTVETLMRLDQQQSKFASFAEILPSLKAQQSGNGGALKPLLTPAQVSANRALIHAYLSSPDCMLFSERAEPLQATGRDFDTLCEAAGGDANECVRIMTQLDAGTITSGGAGQGQQEEKENHSTSTPGMRFQTFPALIQAVGLARAAQQSAEDASSQALVVRNQHTSDALTVPNQNWTPEQREEVLAWLSSPACTLFSSLSASDVTVHLRELDLLMTLGAGSPTQPQAKSSTPSSTNHTLCWLQWLSRAIPLRQFDSFAAMSAALAESVETMRTITLPKLTTMLSKPNCALFHAAQPASAAAAGKNSKGLASGNSSSGGSKGDKQGSASSSSSKRGATGKSSGQPLPGTGSAVAARVTRAAVEELVFASGALLDAPVLLDTLVREGRSFPSLSALQSALAQAHADKRALSFVTDGERGAVVDFLSKENCTLFSEDAATTNDDFNAGGGVASHNSGGDLHVKKSDLDRLIVEGRGLHMTLFYLSALNASGRQFSRFADLIPAVRAAHALAGEQKQELFQKLQACKAALLPTVPGGGQAQLALQPHADSTSELHVDERAKSSNESLVPHLSQADADALYIDGSAGGATIHYLDIFLDSGSSFSSWLELVSAVRELHALVLRNRYAAAVLERSEARLSAQERRNVLLAYLYSSECALFSDAEDVNVSDEDLDALQAEAAGLQVQTTGSPAQQQFALQQSLARANGVGCPLGHALLFLRYIDWSGRKFLSFAPLRAAVRDCYLASIRQKKAILDHLRTGVDAVPTQANATATAVKNAALQTQAQGAAGCKLLSATAAHLQRTLDLRDVDRLFVAGGAGPVTLAYLLELEDAGLAFASLDALVHAVRLAHQQAMDTRATEKKMLLAYLGSGACPLLNPAATSATSSASNATHGAGSSSSASSAPIVKAVSDMELVTLLNVGKGGVSTLFLLQALEAAGRCYPSFPDLLQALKESREGGSQAAQRKKDCAALLRAERCQLLRDLERTPVTQNTLDRLFADGGAGAATLAQLWALQVAGHSFSSVESLAHALRLAHEASVTRAGSERGMLLVHLLGPCAGGVLRAGSANHGLAPLFWLKLSAEDLDQVLALCEGGANALRFLLALARAHRSFDSWPALLDALSDLHEELRVGRSNLLARLTNSDECNLFQTASGAPAIDVHTLTLADMDALTVRTQDARKTLFLLDAFEARRARFASFADLVAAVAQAHFNTLASIKQEKSILFLHLTSVHCSLLAQGVPILEPELDALFLVAGSAKGTLFYLAQLEARHAQYATVPALLADVEKLHEEACKTKADVLAFFHQPSTRLLYPTVGSSAGNGGAGVTAAEVDRLYIDCGVGLELLPLLRSLEAAGSRFVNLAHVAAAVRDLSQRRSALAKEERLLILAFLSRPDCRLFKGPVAAKPADIDALIAAGGGAAADVLQPTSATSDLSPAAQTLELLREMEAAQAAPGAQVDGVDSFPSLISAVSRLRAQSQAQRAAVLAFLTSPRCFLFKDSPEDVVIDMRAVARLFSRAGAGPRTLEHVRALGVAGGRFGSFFNFNELIEAVRALHQQATAREGAEGMDGEALFKEEESKSEAQDSQQKRSPAGDAAADARAVALAEQQSHARAAAAVAAVTLPIDPSRPAPSHTHESILPAGSIQDLLTFLHSPLRRLFRFAGAAGRTPQFVAGPEAETLVAAGGSTPAYVIRLLTEIECGSSTVFSSVEEMAAALQLIAQRESNERKAIAAFLASNKCRLHKLPKHAGSSPNPADSPDALVNPQYTDAQVEELCVRSGAGVFTLHHLHRLNEDPSLYAPDLASLIHVVTRAHAESVETIRQQKQMVRTYLASFHSELLWCVPHAAADAAAGGLGAPVAAPFRHRLRDSDLNHLLLETGGSGSMLLRHLMRLDDSRLNAAASQQEAHTGKSYHSVSDLLHAVRDVHHHELASKKELMEYLNSPACQLWDNSAAAAASSTSQAPPSSYARIASNDVDRLFNGTHAHFDAPLLLGLLAASGRRFTHAQALVDVVKEERTKCSRGPAAEALMVLAHLVSPLCTVLARPAAPSTHINSAAIPVATLDQMLQLLQIGGGGSATLFELYELEAAGVVAPDFGNLVQRLAAATGGGPSMIVKEQLMSYLSDQSSIYRDAAVRLEQLYGHNAANPLSTDSLATLPVTAAGVARMMEESSCGISGVLNGLRNLDRAQLQLLDLRSTVEALADLRMQLPLHERAIEMRRVQLHADKAAAASRTRASSPPTGLDSRWSEDDRRALLAFLSHPDTLLFSESAAALEVTPALLDKVLDAADPVPAAASQEARTPSAQETLVLLAHLNQSARKIADIAELISTIEREHAALDQIAQQVADRLKTAGCALWVAGKQAPPSALTAASLRRPLLLDTHIGPAAMQRLDELELCGRTFTGPSVSQLAAALSELQQGVQARSAAAKDRLVSHLSQAEVSGSLFNQAVSMGDVELAAILAAGRGGANNVRASVDAARAQHRSFNSVSELLARIRGDTQQNEQELLSFLHSPDGSALLSPPAESSRALAFLDSHLLSCMSYLYGSVDAGPETLSRAQRLSAARCSFKNVGQLLEALRDPSTAIRKHTEKSMQPPQAQQQPHDSEAPLAPAPADVDALVSFLQDPATLLFANSEEDLKIETEEILALFASSVSNSSVSQHGSWATTEPHLRSLNAVHRRFQHFSELGPAIRRALAPAQSGCYVSQEQVDEISAAMRLPAMDGLFVGTAELEGITQTHADDLLRLVPIAVVSLSATASGVTELLNHLFSYSRAKRLFPGWPVLRAALVNTIAYPSVGHVSEATLSAVKSFFASAENKLFAPNVIPASEPLIPTGEEVDSLVLSAGGVDAMMESLHTINAKQPGTIQSLAHLNDVMASIKAGAPGSLSLSVSHSRRTSFVAPLPRPVGSSSSSSSDPSYPPLSADDTAAISAYLSSCNLFSTATTELEVNMSTLDALAYECGSVRDLIDILKKFDRAGIKFLTFSEVAPKVDEELKRRKVHEPVGAEPIVRKPSTPRPDTKPVTPFRTPSVAARTLADSEQVLAPPSVASASGAPASSAAADSSVAPALSDADRNRFVSWLQSDQCSFFVDSTQDLTVTLEQLDLLVVVGHGVDNTLHTLQQMSDRGVRFQAFTDILPALRQEIAQRPSAAAAPVASVSSVPAVSVSLSLTDAERDEIVGVLSDSSLFSETAETLELQPSDLDSMASDAGSVGALIAALKELDAKHTRPRNFKELYAIMQTYWANKHSGVASVASAPAAAASSSPSAVPAVVVSPADQSDLIAYISSESCGLFSEAAGDLTVEPEMLDALIIAGGGIASLLATLRALDLCVRRFQSFADLAPAVVEARESGGHIGADATAALVAWMGECSLFSQTAEADSNFEVTVSDMDALVAAGRGMANLMPILTRLDREGIKVERFAQLPPIVAQHWNTQAAPTPAQA